MKKYWITASVAIVVALAVVVSVVLMARRPHEIKIGAILPLTGDAADYGNKTKMGIDFAVQEINASGGINGKKVKIIYEDDRLDPKVGLDAFYKLAVADGVPCIIGPISSGVVLSIAPEANEKKVVVLSTYASNPKITEAGDYIFRIYPSDAIQGVVDADLVMKMGYKKVAILYVNSDYGVGITNVFAKRFNDLGGNIVSEQSFNTGDTDFRGQLTKIKNSDANLIYMPGNAKEMALILIQAKQLGVHQQFFATDSFLESTVLETAKGAANGVIFTVPQVNHDSVYESFATKWKDQYGNEPGLLESLGYDGAWIMALAIKDGGYNSSGIKEALYSIKHYHGVTGDITFDENGDITRKNYSVKTIIDGKVVDYTDAATYQQ